MVSVSAHIGRQKYRVEITDGKNTVIGDEPLSLGGGETGFDPYRLLLSSLAACTCATVRMYADRRNMQLEKIKIDLTLERDSDNNITNITRNIQFVGVLNEEEKTKLLSIAEKCPVHKILTNPIHISTQLL
jgi:putative redox protein